MKTFIHACNQVKKRGLPPSEQWLMVKAILMTKLNMERQDEFKKSGRSYSYKVSDLFKFHQN